MTERIVVQPPIETQTVAELPFRLRAIIEAAYLTEAGCPCCDASPPIDAWWRDIATDRLPL